MLNLLLNLKIDKIKKRYNAHSIKAGIVFNNEGLAVGKIMFEVIDGGLVEILSDSNFSLDESEENYVGNIVSFEWLLKNFFGTSNLTFYQILMAYKMFLNDANFLNKHLDYFGMYMRPVGYKEKWEIARDPSSFNTDGQKLYYSLINIIDYKNINKRRLNESIKVR